MTHRIFATCDTGKDALDRFRERGWEVEVYDQVQPPPKALVLEKVRSGIAALVTTLRDPIDDEIFAAGAAAGLGTGSGAGWGTGWALPMAAASVPASTPAKIMGRSFMRDLGFRRRGGQWQTIAARAMLERNTRACAEPGPLFAIGIRRGDRKLITAGRNVCVEGFAPRASIYPVLIEAVEPIAKRDSRW